MLSRPDKGEVADADGGNQEEDVLMQDEIFKSRLASIKRVSMFPFLVLPFVFLLIS